MERRGCGLNRQVNLGGDIHKIRVKRSLSLGRSETPEFVTSTLTLFRSDLSEGEYLS